MHMHVYTKKKIYSKKNQVPDALAFIDSHKVPGCASAAFSYPTTAGLTAHDAHSHAGQTFGRSMVADQSGSGVQLKCT